MLSCTHVAEIVPTDTPALSSQAVYSKPFIVPNLSSDNLNSKSEAFNVTSLSPLFTVAFIVSSAVFPNGTTILDCANSIFSGTTTFTLSSPTT